MLPEMRAQHVPALSVAVIHRGKIDWAKGYGVANAAGTPVTPHTLFQAASISKSVAAMAALHLVEQGKLALDAPVPTALHQWHLTGPALTPQHPVTLRALLSHTAGTSVPGYDGYAAGAAVPTLPQVLDGQSPANSAPVVVRTAPGTAYAYSGGGYSVVQQLLGEAQPQAFADLLRTTVLGPCGMTASTFAQPLPAAQRPAVAQPTNGFGQYLPGGPHTYPEQAAAGLWTTASDLARWIIEVQGSLAGRANHVLSAPMTRTMLTPVQAQYGLGVETGGGPAARYFAHSGANAGYNTYYIGYERGEGAVVLTNSNSGDVVIQELLRSIARAYGWPDFKPVPRVLADVPLPVQARYRGHYRAEGLVDFNVQLVGQQLQLVVPDQLAYTLLPAAPSLFFARDSELQVRFDSRDRGVILFKQPTGSLQAATGVPFHRLTPHQR
ncbi:MAG: class A beta-lactamase-related serine hydrolase [Cytophagaceae bacterium]|nr:MAG: class A beta-lactamase-related serine hydrolase [Cytophagaceae bacterium]